VSKIRAFVAHSFNEERDGAIVRAFTEYFDSLKETAGFTWEHAERSESKAISEKVKGKMEGKNLFIGIFTANDYRIKQNNLRTSFPIYSYAKKEYFSEGSSDWIIQESADYGQFSKAADKYMKISEMKEMKLNAERRVNYVAKAADCYASDNKFHEAYSIILAEFRNTELDTNILYILYKKLSDIAKMQDNKKLFVAFAEKALEIFPTDYSLRFSLAYLYEEVGNHARSLAHYIFLCEHNPNGVNFNNIGVTYGKLDMKGKSIESYIIASEKYCESLAMANIAYSYIDQGFFKAASDILKVSKEQENYHKNVDSATTRITEIEEEEKESLKKTLKKIEPEEKFLVRFAEAYALPFKVDVTGEWSSMHGEIRLDMKDGKVYGSTESNFQSLSNTLAVLKIGGLATGQEVSKRTISIDGIITNSSIEYQLKIETTSGSTFLTGIGGTKRVYKGLMHVSQDARKIFAMEWTEDKPEIEFYEMVRST